MLKPKDKPKAKKAEADKPKEKLAAPAVAKSRPKIMREDH